MILYLLFLTVTAALLVNALLLVNRIAPDLKGTALKAWGANTLACLIAFQFGDLRNQDYVTTWNEFGKEAAYDINTPSAIADVYAAYFRDAYILLTASAHHVSENALALIVLVNVLSSASLILLGGLCASLVGNSASAKTTCWAIALWPSTIAYTAHISPDIVCASLALMAATHALVAKREGMKAHIMSIMCLALLILFRAHMTLLITATIVGLSLLRWKETPFAVKAMYAGGLAASLALLLIENPLAAGTLDELWTRLNEGAGIKIGLRDDQGGLLGRLSAMPLLIRALSGILLYPFTPMPFWEYHENSFSGWLRTLDTISTGLLGAWFFRGVVLALRHKNLDAIWMAFAFAATTGAIGALYSLVDPRFRVASIIWYLVLGFYKHPSPSKQPPVWPIVSYFAMFGAAYLIFFRIR
jgi:hypothetical protein